MFFLNLSVDEMKSKKNKVLEIDDMKNKRVKI
jgi:hypothetical protein